MQLTDKYFEQARVINSIDWYISTKCNDICKFCYAPPFKEHDFSLEHYQKIARRIKQLDFEWVTICGGEPTMNAFALEIVQYLKKLGLKITFYCNGININTLMKISPYADIISLPIECIDDASGNLRSKLQQTKVMECIEMLSKLNVQPKVKIGTVATKQNIGELAAIQQLIEKYPMINVWRIYQFSPAERAKQYENLYAINEEEFNDAVQKRIEHIRNHHYQISPRSRYSNRGYCVIMDEVGDLYRYEEKYINTGVNILRCELKEIEVQYKLDIHVEQKKWLNRV